MIERQLLEDLMARARLSTREREVMRLECAAPLSDEEIAARLGCGIASVRTYRQRGRKKLRLAAEAYEREQLGREREELDLQDLAENYGVERFLLQAITPPQHPDHGPQISITYVQYDLQLKREFVMAEEAALHAGALVTPKDVRNCVRPKII